MKTLGSAAVLGALLVAVPATPVIADTPGGFGSSAIGNYLAGRHAEAERDLSAAADFLMQALADAPDAPDLLRRTFVLLILEGRMDEARTLAGRLIEIRPKSAIANLLLITDDIKERRFMKARARLEGLSDAGISGLIGPTLEAWALAGEKKFEEALAKLSPSDGETVAQPLLDLHRGLILDLADRRDEAVEALKTLFDGESGGSFRLVQLLGNLLERMDRRDEAKALYDGYAADHPGTSLLEQTYARLAAKRDPRPMIRSAADGAAEVFFGVGNSLRQQRANETALALGRMAMHLRPDNPIMLIMAGELMESDERLEDADQFYAGIGEDSDFHYSALMRRASNLHDMERTDDAIEMLRTVAAHRPDDPEPMRTIGDFLRSRERYGEAIPEYDEAVRRAGALETHHWRLLYTRGIVLEREKQWERAEEDFLKALEFQPDQPYVLNYLGYSWIEQGRNLERAQDMIRQAVKLRPNDGYIIDSLGWVYYRLGKYDDAVVELERAVEYRPEDPIINDHLGDAYWRVGRRLEARFQWKRSLSLDPEPDVIEKIRDKLKNGLGDEDLVTPVGDDESEKAAVEPKEG